jgi:hypothetical protein
MAAVGGEVNSHLREHFLTKNTKGNKRGWPRSNFWSKTVRAATSLGTVTDDSAEVVIASREFAQRLYGGTITARRRKFLAIPLTARAKAAGSPREGAWRGGTLTFIRTTGGRALLIEASHTRLTRRGGRIVGGKESGGEAQYILLRRVRQNPDPTALPRIEQITAGIDKAATTYLQREIRRAAGTAAKP